MKFAGFVKISKYAGMREDLVQAGGGNSAYKFAIDRMAVKASGIQLADITETEGYAIINPQIVRQAFLNSDNWDALTEDESKKLLSEAFIEGARPSIETFLHSISGRYSLHTHPVAVNAAACRENGVEIFKEMFPDALVVPYAAPGINLAKAYFKAYRNYKKFSENEPAIVFLMNHGLLVSAQTAEEVVAITEQVTKRIEDYLHADFDSYHMATAIMDLYEDGIVWRAADANVLESYKEIDGIWDHSFCPDCVVFLGKKMYEIAGDDIDKEDFAQFVKINGYPVIISFKNHLYIHADSVKKAMEIQSVLSFSAQVMKMNIGEKCRLLTEVEKNFLLNRDDEKYRRNMK